MSYKSIEDLLSWTKKTPSGCLEWQRSLDRHGYGAAWQFGRAAQAHRLSWELVNGAIPKKMWVLHSCDNRKCVNPSHLRLGDHADNMNDRMIRKRTATAERSGRKKHPERFANAVMHGSKNPASKLTEDTVRMIRASPGSHRIIAERFGISKSAVEQIVNRKMWAHVV